MIGAILSGAGALAGGIMGAVSARKQKKALREQRQHNDAWYERNYNEDATQRADAQAMMNKVREDVKDRNRQSAGRLEVSGGTEEGVRAAAAETGKAVGDAAARVTAASAARKDAVESAHKQREDRLDNMEMQINAQETANIAAATKGLTAAAGSLAGGLTGKSGGNGASAAAPTGDLPDAPVETPAHTGHGAAHTNDYAQSGLSLFDMAEDAGRNDFWMV